MNKDHHTLSHIYALIKNTLIKNGYKVNPYIEKNNTLHFMVFLEQESGSIQLLHNKNGPDYDLSDIHSPPLKNHIQTLIQPHFKSLGKLLTFDPANHKQNLSPQPPQKEPVELIGILTLGKENYFGPLITSAIYVKKSSRNQLKQFELEDYINWPDHKFHYIAKLISDACEHSSIIMFNDSYNQIFEKIQNIHHIIAWSQFKVIENLRRQIKASHVVSTNFGNKAIIDATLLSKGYDMILYQKNTNPLPLPIIAAYITAKSQLLKEFKKMKKSFNIPFQEGNDSTTLTTGKKLFAKYGKDIFNDVAKLHFPTTNSIIETS